MTRTQGKTKADYEDTNWEDTGCEYEPSCLECPRPLRQCPDMVPRLRQKISKKRRRIAIMAMKADGFSTKEVAEALKVSVRTVARAIGGK